MSGLIIIDSYNPRSWEAKAEGLQVQDQLGLWNKALYQNQNQTTKKPRLGEVVFLKCLLACMRPWIWFPAPNKGGIEVPVILASEDGSKGSRRDEGHSQLPAKFEDR